MTPADARTRAAHLIHVERDVQIALWGAEQALPVVFPGVDTLVAARGLHEVPSAQAARETVSHRSKRGTLSFADIFLEEVSEAIEASAEHGEASNESLEEWVQVAAVAAQIVEKVLLLRARRAATPVVGWDGNGSEATDAPR